VNGRPDHIALNACTSPASCAPSQTPGACHPAERLCDTPLQITGTYNGAGGDQSNVPDFYDMFCRTRGKPMVIGEVSLSSCLWLVHAFLWGQQRRLHPHNRAHAL
jgi:hypothetical protein